MEEFELARNDWELTLQELKGQRVSLAIQTTLNAAAIAGIEAKLAKMPKVKANESKTEIAKK